MCRGSPCGCPTLWLLYGCPIKYIKNMAYLVKRFARTLLKPFAQVINKLNGWRKLWAHTCLSTKLSFPLDISIVVLECPEIHGSGRIQLGKNLLLYKGLYLETQAIGHIDIGDEVVISRGVHIVSFSHITIGANTMIGEYTSIRDANHKQDNQAIRYAGHVSQPISIGKNVWIGRGVTILAGVTIGDNAIIGANAVVTKDIPANCVAVGLPAKPIDK